MNSQRSSLRTRVFVRFFAVVLALAGVSALTSGLLRGSMPDVQTGTWAPAGSLSTVRSGASAVLLPSGGVLVTGGAGTSGSLETVDFFGADGSFTAVAPMNEARADHTAVPLKDGRVLVVGGRNATGAAPSAEIFADGAWMPAAGLTDARWGHTATALKDGRVLIAGGENASGAVLSLEIFDPETGVFAVAGTMAAPRKGHAAALLSDGRVILAGGATNDAALATTEIFNPETLQLSAGPSLNVPRYGLSATTLLDGRVVFIGGHNGTQNVASAEIYSDVTSAITYTATATPMVARRNHQAILLANNNAVLIVGGIAEAMVDGVLTARETSAAELYLPWINEVWQTGGMTAARAGATGAALSVESYGAAPAAEGFVMVAGGQGTASTELYRFATIRTDKDDYLPGMKVYVSGSGWQPLETVTFALRELPAEHASRTFAIQADEQGRIDNAFLFDVEDHHLGVRFYLTARGAASQAQVTFTDGFKINVAVSAPGSSATITAEVFRSNASCSGVPTSSSSHPLNHLSSATAAQNVGSNQSIRLTAPALAANGVAFESWTANASASSMPGFDAFNRIICLAGQGATSNNNQGDLLFTANYSTASRTTTTTLTRTTGVTPNDYGDALTFTATVAAESGNPSSVGSVTFKNGSNIVCNAVPLSGNTATCSPALAPASYSLTAEYSGVNSGSPQFAASTSSPMAQVVNPRTLTASFTASDKQYDGTAAATIATRSLSGVLAGDAGNVSLTGGTASFDSPAVGTNKTVTATGFTLTGSAAANYSLAGVMSWTTTASITPVTLTPTVTVVNKTYDGTTSATISTRTFSNDGAIVPEDDVTLTGGTGLFENKNVGTAKPVNITELSLGGADAANYVLSSTSATATADITQLSITGSFTASNKVYDGTPAATVLTRTFTGAISGDAMTLDGGTATFDTKHVGTSKTVTLAGATLAGADAGNYSLGSVATTTADITALSITGSFTANNKVYDGTTAVTITARSLTGAISGDAVTLDGGTAAFDTKHVGTGKTVTLAGATLAGADAGNYSLGSVTTTTADITAMSVTGSFTASNKVYDGTTAATITARSLTGAISGDAVTLDGGTAAFDTKHVGTGKTVTLAGATLAGADANNYSLGSVGTTTADITARPLVVSATGVNRIYDGTSSATVTLSDDRVSGDVLTPGYTSASFADKNVGNSKPVSVNGITVTGTDAGNYTFNAAATTTADITARPLVVSATGVNRMYDGTTSATVTLSDDRVSGDVLTPDYTSASFADKNVGNSKPVSVNGITVTGTDAVNYTSNATATTTADITARPLTVSATGQNKVYDGNTTATVTLSDDRIGGDVFTTAYAAASFADKNVGNSKPVSVNGITVTGTDAGNYTFNTTAATTADITSKSVTGSFTPAHKAYDGNVSATVLTRSPGAVIAGDDVQLTGGTAAFNDKNVGIGKSVTLTGATLSGSDAPNYVLSAVATSTANITVRPLIVSATGVDKVYDGTTVATVTLSDNRVGGDALTVSYFVAAFDSRNAGIGKPVSVTGIAITGTDAGNYSANTTASTTASITPKTVTGSFTAADKTLDGNTNATITARLLNGQIAGDAVHLSGGTATFDNPNVGLNKLVTGVGFTLAGTDSGNYSLASSTLTTTASITYLWTGFLQPINDTAHQIGTAMSKFKLNQTIPAKFELRDANGNVVQQSGSPRFNRSGNLGTCGAATEAESVGSLPIDTLPVYNWNGSHYQYNWSTKGLAAGMYRIYAELADGTKRYVDICLTK